MVIIVFPSDADWCKANWVFRQLAQDMVAAAPDNSDLKYILDKAQAFGALSFKYLSIEESSAVMAMLQRVAEETLQGKIPGWKQTKPLDEEGHRMYIESIAELLEVIKKETG